jgi:membrane-bound lytic murein transglycosylase A
MKRKLALVALVSLSLGMTLIAPVLSVFAQIPIYPPYPPQDRPETWSPVNRKNFHR